MRRAIEYGGSPSAGDPGGLYGDLVRKQSPWRSAQRCNGWGRLGNQPREIYEVFGQKTQKRRIASRWLMFTLDRQ